MTFTKSWLQKQITDIEATRDEIPFGLDEDGNNTLSALKLALAGMETEPVAWLLSGGGAKNNVSFDSGNAYADPLREVTPLYTATPAPVVPDAIPKLKDDQRFKYVKDGIRYSVSYANGWNACRAAMLQGGNHAEQHLGMVNSPVIPDGWVACSERMPHIGVPVITCCGDVVQYAAYSWDGKEWQDWYEEYDKLPASTFTHWHSRPAAPQQGVKP